MLLGLVFTADIKRASSNDKTALSSAATATTSNKSSLQDTQATSTIPKSTTSPDNIATNKVSSPIKPPLNNTPTSKDSYLSEAALPRVAFSIENSSPIKQLASVCVPTSTYLAELQHSTAPASSSFIKPLPSAAPVINKNPSFSRSHFSVAPCRPLPSCESYSSIPPVQPKLRTCRWSYRSVRPLLPIQPPQPARPAPPPPPLPPVAHARSMYPPGNPLYYKPSYYPRY